MATLYITTKDGNSLQWDRISATAALVILAKNNPTKWHFKSTKTNIHS